MNALPLIITVFVACAVEAVEALTIVLATGITREWKSTFQGMGAALVVLAVITAAIGPAVSHLPLTGLRLVVGALLAIFGLQWLRKAVLRAAGYKALHDEAGAYRREVAAAEAAARESRRGVSDWMVAEASRRSAALPSAGTSMISTSESFRLAHRRNAMFWPSGDHAGEASRAGCVVSRIGSPGPTSLT